MAESASSFEMTRMYFYKNINWTLQCKEGTKSSIEKQVQAPELTELHYSHPRKAFSLPENLPASSAWHCSGLTLALTILSTLSLESIYFLAHFSDLWFCASTAGYCLQLNIFCDKVNFWSFRFFWSQVACNTQSLLIKSYYYKSPFWFCKKSDSSILPWNSW